MVGEFVAEQVLELLLRLFDGANEDRSPEEDSL
jgi:hypothetical protein